MARTTLILGAGASIPYGFPSGEQLIDKVVGDFGVIHRHYYGDDERRRKDARDAIRDQLKNESYESIDQYLRDKTFFANEIRATIFKVIMEAENAELAQLGLPGGPGKQNWYKYYFNRLMKDKKAIESLGTQTIISFNYDRSFEYFLARFIQGRMGFGKIEEAFALLHEKFKIIHVHGRLPNMPGEKYFKDDELEIPYAKGNFQQVLLSLREEQVLKKYISTVYESRNSEVVLKDLLASANRIIFLGLGYLEDNMEKLGVYQLKKERQDIDVIGTGFKLGAMELATITGKGIRVNPNREHDCLDLFREFFPIK